MPFLGLGVQLGHTLPPPGGGGASFPNTYSVSFDGTNDYVDAVSNPNLDVYSLSFWVKTSNTSAAQQHPVGGFGRTNLAPYGGMYIKSTAGRVLEFNDGQYGIFAGNIAQSDVADGAWHHIALVYVPSGYTTTTGTATNSGEGYKIFLDGTRVDTAMNSTSYNYGLASTTVDFKVGREGKRATYYLDGLIDEVAIFGSSLLDSDVTDIYNSGVPTDLSSYSPTLWWRMGDDDSGTGTTITDQGSGGNDGTLVNGPTFSTDVPS
jgi:hypothetical protein